MKTQRKKTEKTFEELMVELNEVKNTAARQATALAKNLMRKVYELSHFEKLYEIFLSSRYLKKMAKSLVEVWERNAQQVKVWYDLHAAPNPTADRLRHLDLMRVSPFAGNTYKQLQQMFFAKGWVEDSVVC